ncbi:MAG: hypothetical protein RRY29_06460 [Desulfovibrionaceae bacterium]
MHDTKQAAALQENLREKENLRILTSMEMYTPPYLILLLTGAILQAAYAFSARGTPAVGLFSVAISGACAVLISAYLEQDVVLACGQGFLLWLLWRLAADSADSQEPAP